MGNLSNNITPRERVESREYQLVFPWLNPRLRMGDRGSLGHLVMVPTDVQAK